MLVLSRFKKQSILIGHDVRIIVVDVRGKTVRLGIEAPKETPVHREEVYRAICGEAERDLPTRPQAASDSPKAST